MFKYEKQYQRVAWRFGLEDIVIPFDKTCFLVTSLLSKQWRSLWTRVPRLEYDVQDLKNRARFERFIVKSLFAHQSHVLKTLCFKVNVCLWNNDIGPWIRTALHHHHCHLRELEIDAFLVHTLLPPELFTCKNTCCLETQMYSDRCCGSTSYNGLSPIPKNYAHWALESLLDFGSLQLLLSSCNFLTDLMVTRESRFYFVELVQNTCGLETRRFKGCDQHFVLSGMSPIPQNSACCTHGELQR